MSNVLEEYDLDEITPEEIQEFMELIKTRDEVDEKIFNIRHNTPRKSLLKKYFIDFKDSGIQVRKMNGAGGKMMIDTKELIEIEEYTGTKLHSISNYAYTFLWGDLKII